MNTLESLKAQASLSERLLIDRAVELAQQSEVEDFRTRCAEYLFRVQKALIRHAEKKRMGQHGAFEANSPFEQFFRELPGVIEEVKP